MKYLLILAVCFLIGSSFATGGKFLPRTSRERSIVIGLTIFVILLIIGAIWVIWNS